MYLCSLILERGKLFVCIISKTTRKMRDRNLLYIFHELISLSVRERDRERYEIENLFQSDLIQVEPKIGFHLFRHCWLKLYIDNFNTSFKIYQIKHFVRFAKSGLFYILFKILVMTKLYVLQVASPLQNCRVYRR